MNIRYKVTDLACQKKVSNVAQHTFASSQKCNNYRGKNNRILLWVIQIHVS